MKLENQVCTLEQAKEFGKYGLKLNSFWRWQDWDVGAWELVSCKDCSDGDDSLPAYSCAELCFIWEQIQDKCTKSISLSKVVSSDRLLRVYLLNINGAPSALGDFTFNAHVKSEAILTLIKEKIIKPEDLSL